MAGSQTKALALILLLLFIHLSIGQVWGVAQGMKYANPQSEPIIAAMKKIRKLVEIDLCWTMIRRALIPNMIRQEVESLLVATAEPYFMRLMP
ncbi:hypothetical protein GH714_011222 [Hevea brasiliensis]|uniref:Uncharacterized protein n=1 Tax=Hevea brasiliensis TaxID=3981 RepID=A0A6A6MKI9_HEVBR|nr:hypothetical protein GH714_011222 [Hevea brasiliensis]